MAFKIEEQTVTFRWPIHIQMPRDGGGHDDIEIEATMRHVASSMQERLEEITEEFREASRKIDKGDRDDSDVEHFQALEAQARELREELRTAIVVDLYHIDRITLLKVVDEDGNQVTDTTAFDPEFKQTFIEKLLRYPPIEQAIGAAYREATSGLENQPKHRTKN